MKKVGRVVALVAIFGVIFAALVSSSVKPADVAGKIWTEAMTLGDAETATKHYIVYTDLMCPYCNYYAKLVAENETEAKEYFAENKILYEIRVTDMLYEGSGVEYSRPAAEAAYCAAREGKFFEFYHEYLTRIFEDYYEKGVGSSKTAPAIADLSRDYFSGIAKKAGVEGEFEKCYEGREAVEEVAEKTVKASAVAQGLPYFYFGKFSTGGFDPGWEFDVVKSLWDQGLK